MRIAAVRTHVLEAKLSQPFAWSFSATDTRASCLVEIVAEDGTTGWGECYGPAQLNAAVVRTMAADLIGKDALASELHWQHLYNRFRDQG
jgi:D-galactarolactone cycloisomerase